MKYWLKVEDLLISDVRSVKPPTKIYVPINPSGIDLMATREKLGKDLGIEGILLMDQLYGLNALTLN